MDVSRGVSAPLVLADSLIVVASLDRNLDLVLPAAQPRVVWDHNFKGAFRSAPIVEQGRLYLGETLRGGRLLALDLRTRETLWTADAGDLEARPVVFEGRIYTVSTPGVVRAWNGAGEEQWKTELETRVVSAPALLGDTLVVASSDGRLFALDATSGEIVARTDPDAGPIWADAVTLPAGEARPTALCVTLGGHVLEIAADLTVVQRRSFPARFYSAPAVEGSRLYLTDHEGLVWAYDWARTEILWMRDLGQPMRVTPALAEAYVAIGDLTGTFYVLDRMTGEVEWKTKLDGPITSRALPHGDALYVATESGELYAFRPSGATDGR